MLRTYEALSTAIENCDESSIREILYQAVPELAEKPHEQDGPTVLSFKRKRFP